jgi:hypothetical protein
LIKSLHQLPFGYKPKKITNATLSGEVQAILDRLDLQKLRKEAKRSTNQNQTEQKERFGALKFKSSQYKVQDVASF